MFENLIKDAEARLNLSDESVSALVRGLLFLMLNEGGGIEGFVDRFRRVGLSDVVTSWLGGKEGRLMTALDVESALGMSALDRLAASSGLTRGVVGSVVAFLLPRMMSRLTANGIIPSRSLVSQVSSDKRAVLPLGLGSSPGSRTGRTDPDGPVGCLGRRRPPSCLRSPHRSRWGPPQEQLTHSSHSPTEMDRSAIGVWSATKPPGQRS